MCRGDQDDVTLKFDLPQYEIREFASADRRAAVVPSKILSRSGETAIDDYGGRIAAMPGLRGESQLNRGTRHVVVGAFSQDCYAPGAEVGNQVSVLAARAIDPFDFRANVRQTSTTKSSHSASRIVFHGR